MSDWPSQLPGLDINQALNQLGGKKTLYLRLMGMFMDGHANDAERIRAAASEQDWTSVYEINHALKGVTGNIAATDLYQLCVALDAKIKQENYDVVEEIEQMPGAMAQLLESVEVVKGLPAE